MTIWICTECDSRRESDDRPARGMCVMSDDGEGPHAWSRFAETLTGASEQMSNDDRRFFTGAFIHQEQGGLER